MQLMDGQKTHQHGPLVFVYEYSPQDEMGPEVVEVCSVWFGDVDITEWTCESTISAVEDEILSGMKEAAQQQRTDYLINQLEAA